MFISHATSFTCADNNATVQDMVFARIKTQKLGELLVSSGAVGRAQVDAALAGPGRLASELLRLGMASERVLALALAEQQGHPAVVLSESSFELAALELIPRVIAEAHRVLAIAIDGETISVAVAALQTADGSRPPIFDQIEFATGRRLVLYLGVESVIAEATAMTYDAQRAGQTVVNGTPGLTVEGLAIVRPQSGVIVGAIIDEPSTAPFRPPPPPTPPSGSDKALIMVVDDEDDIRHLIKKVLSYDGYEVIEARTGREALQRLRSARPQLILLDAMLPEIHGFDICATLKRSDVFAATPIVVISAVYKGWEHARTVQEVHGADAFVEKPFDVHYLRQLAARLVGKVLPKTPLGADWQKKVKALREEAANAYTNGDMKAAEELIKRWRALDPFDANAYLMLGNVRSKGGDLDGAMKAYERAAAFDADLFAAFKNLAVVYDQLGFLQRAQMAWYRAFELCDDVATKARIEARLNR